VQKCGFENVELYDCILVGHYDCITVVRVKVRSTFAIIGIYCIAVKWGYINQKLAVVQKCMFDSQRVRGWRGGRT
jgi:hypothetical protein